MRKAKTGKAKEDPLLGEVEDLIGAEAYRALVQALGGKRIRVPAKIGPHHPLAMAIGLDLAQRLAKEFAPHSIDLPIAAKKRYLIAQALSAGKSVSSIAATFYCTQAFVFKVKATLAAETPVEVVDPKQMRLL